jgi:hypothetical protein
VDELTDFMTRPQPVLSEVLAAYADSDKRIEAVVHLALVEPGQKLELEKPESELSMPGFLGGSSVTIYFYIRPVEGLLPEDHPCRLWVVDGEVDTSGMGAITGPMAAAMSDEALDYVILSGAERNLYQEIAVRGRLEPADPEAEESLDTIWKYDEEKAPAFKATSWDQETLELLREASNGLDLDICELPVK